jgi:methylated-DNA-protein-cysteine methyltransferase-like protein
MATWDDFLDQVASVDYGKVVSYGEIARRAGSPKGAISVGHALLVRGDDVPWWRVVNAKGRLHPHKSREHAEKLECEGVHVLNGRVPIARVARPPKASGSRKPGKRAAAAHKL